MCFPSLLPTTCSASIGFCLCKYSGSNGFCSARTCAPRLLIVLVDILSERPPAPPMPVGAEAWRRRSLCVLQSCSPVFYSALTGSSLLSSCSSALSPTPAECRVAHSSYSSHTLFLLESPVRSSNPHKVGQLDICSSCKLMSHFVSVACFVLSLELYPWVGGVGLGIVFGHQRLLLVLLLGTPRKLELFKNPGLRDDALFY